MDRGRRRRAREVSASRDLFRLDASLGLIGPLKIGKLDHYSDWVGQGSMCHRNLRAVKRES